MDTKGPCEPINERGRRLQAALDCRKFLLANTGKPGYLGLTEVAIPTNLTEISANVCEHGASHTMSCRLSRWEIPPAPRHDNQQARSPDRDCT
jgi:hypothetical protein